jgi:hypothetical protein
MTFLDRGTVRRAYFRSRSLRLPLTRVRYSRLAPNDLFIASYPRSGTTWLRFLLFELLSGNAAEFVSVNEAIPYVGKHQRAPQLLPNGGRVIQTHETFLRGVASAIYVVRDPRSVVLSEFRWQLRTGLSRGSFEPFFDAFLTGRANPYGRWDRHVDTWLASDLASEDRLHVVRFEDLRTDTVGELTRILDALGLRVDTASIEQVVANNGLTRMRAKEERAPRGALGESARPDIRFVNSGSTSGWKEQLSLEHVRRIEEQFGEQLSSLGYQPLPVAPSTHRPSSVAGVRHEQVPSPDAPLKVIYIAGWGRSGSTLLDSLLGQIDGFFSTGELRYIWERGVLGDWKCGCGRTVKRCEVWSVVLAKLEADGRGPDARRILRWQKQVTRFRHTSGLLKLTSHDLPGHFPLEPYVELTGRLFSALADVTGARVIVDSSKRPSDAAILDLVPGVELYVVHLVRDPRAVAYSWGTRQPDIDSHGVAASTTGWVAWNLACEALRRKIPERSTLVRYEDFVKQPHATLERIVELVGEDPSRIPPMREGTFDIAGTHTVSGNPGRFRSGSIEVRPDTRWLQRLGPVPKAAATTIALPLLRRYGYPTWIGSGNGERRSDGRMNAGTPPIASRRDRPGR